MSNRLKRRVVVGGGIVTALFLACLLIQYYLLHCAEKRAFNLKKWTVDSHFNHHEKQDFAHVGSFKIAATSFLKTASKNGDYLWRKLNLKSTFCYFLFCAWERNQTLYEIC